MDSGKPAGETLAEQLAKFVVGLRYEDLPAEIVDCTKALVLDQLACQIIGSTMPWVAPAMELARLATGAAAESTVVRHGYRLPAAEAAFVNATFGQACELDDSAHGSAGHIGTATIPVAVAMAERERIDGRALITAIVAGYEVMYRLMSSVYPNHNTRGFHSQSIAGPFAGAAAAGKILGLNTTQITHALAIAGSHACGPLEYDQSGGEVKRIHAGLGARGGVHSALLAKFGLTGPPTIVEGKRGFGQIFSTKFDPAKITSRLGETFNIANTWFKVYPVNGNIHTPIAGTARLVAEHDIKPEQVERIRVGVSEAALLHGAGIRQPEDVIGAQFSLVFSLALALVKRNNVLSDYMKPALWRDPMINDLIGRIDLYALSEAKGEKLHASVVAIELKDGRVVEATELYPKGTPPNPASRELLASKVSDLFASVLSSSAIEKIIERVENLDKNKDVSELVGLLVEG
jgi:2-methylcitrate dehydratase PrpD